MSKARAKNQISEVQSHGRSINKCQRVPTIQLLPREIVERLGGHLDKPMTAARVQEIATAFDTENQYGVSPRRLGYLLRKLQSNLDLAKPAAKPTIKPNTSPQPNQDNNLGEENEGENWTQRVREHRRRQVTIAAILDSTFGNLSENSPELWAKRAYLMLVGVVYDRLVCAEQELDTDELIKLAKVLAESRRVELRAKDTQSLPVPSPHMRSNGTMPKHIVDTVRQIYGVNLEESVCPADVAGEESTSTASTSSEAQDNQPTH